MVKYTLLVNVRYSPIDIYLKGQVLSEEEFVGLGLPFDLASKTEVKDKKTKSPVTKKDEEKSGSDVP